MSVVAAHPTFFSTIVCPAWRGMVEGSGHEGAGGRQRRTERSDAHYAAAYPPHDPPASAAHLSNTSGKNWSFSKVAILVPAVGFVLPPFRSRSMGGRGGFLPAFLPHLPSGKNLLLSSCIAGQRGRIYGTKLAFVILQRLFALRFLPDICIT